jgi:hypothetical protein
MFNALNSLYFFSDVLVVSYVVMVHTASQGIRSPVTRTAYEVPVSVFLLPDRDPPFLNHIRKWDLDPGCVESNFLNCGSQVVTVQKILLVPVCMVFWKSSYSIPCGRIQMKSVLVPLVSCIREDIFSLLCIMCWNKVRQNKETFFYWVW